MLANSRPLYSPSEDARDETPLTPADFLGTGSRYLQSIPCTASNTRPNHVFKDTMARATLELWKIYETEYFTTLHSVREKRHPVKPMATGDLVHVLDKTGFLGYYKIGKILEIIPSADGVDRRFILLCNGEKIERSYNQVAPFL